jgi:protein-tyrosine phosphatase
MRLRRERSRIGAAQSEPSILIDLSLNCLSSAVYPRPSTVYHRRVSEIFWIEGDPQARLAIVMRPAGDDWLEDELRALKRGGIDTLVSMLEPWEAAELGLAREGPLAEEAGMRFLSFPIPDRCTPLETAAFRQFAGELARRLRAGERIGVHCRGSIGRSTVAAASALVHLGWSPRDAVLAIADARRFPVPDTDEQREWILGYEPEP